MKKVLYIINYAPNYRNIFLEEFAKFVDLTVVSFDGSNHHFKNPSQRRGYRYIELYQKRIFNISYNLQEFLCGSGDYEVVILGYNLRNPFRLLNLTRKAYRRVILEGIIYGRANNFFIAIARRFVISQCESVLVYSELVKQRLKHETNKPIIVFNNTSFSRNDVYALDYCPPDGRLNLLWVGRYQARKKVERLVDLARREKRVSIRLVGPGIRQNIALGISDDNIKIYDEAYDEDLMGHFKWAHAVFNPGGAGLLVMNAARFGRPIIIDKHSYHGPEIQLALDADQIFIDYLDYSAVKEVIDKAIADQNFLFSLGTRLASIMLQKYTVEYMAQQYLKAVDGHYQT